jgi:hypothetical protein
MVIMIITLLNCAKPNSIKKYVPRKPILIRASRCKQMTINPLVGMVRISSLFNSLCIRILVD